VFTNEGTEKNGPFKVAPHCFAIIHYTTVDGEASGTWRITDANGETRTWDYKTKFPFGEAPKIEHSGRTGSVYLNDPADGDMTVGEDFWNH
jgi:hypothetical protein